MRRRLVVLGSLISLVLLSVAPAAPAAAVPPGAFGADINVAQDPVEAHIRNSITITVVNNLPVTLTSVAFNYSYSFGYDGHPAGCDAGPGPLPAPSGTCVVGTLASGQSRAFTFNVIPIPGAGMSNNVSASGSGRYCVLFPFCTTFSFDASRTFGVMLPADPVTIEGKAEPAVTYAGGDEDIVVTFTIHNRMTTQAVHTKFHFSLPPELPLSKNDARCPTSPCDIKDEYTDPHIGIAAAASYWFIGPGDSLTLTYVLKPAVAGKYKAFGRVTGDYSAPGTVPIDESVEVPITILEPRVDLSAAITPQPGYVGDDDMTLTYVIHNPLLHAISVPALAFTLPAGLEVSQRDPICPTSPCTKIGTEILPDMYSFDPDQTVTLTFKIKPSAVGDFTASAEFTGKVCHCNAPIHETTSIPVKVVQSRALSLAVTVTPGTGYVGGDNIVVKYTATNTNGHTLYGIVLNAQTPAGLAVVSDLDGCLAIKGCQFPLLAPGGSHEWSVVLAPSKAVGATVTGTVIATRPTDQATASAPLVVLAPVLTVNPGVGKPGFVALAKGAQFPPGAKVQLRWSIGLTAGGNVVVVDSTGNLTWQALVFPRDVLGKRKLVATWVAGPKFGAVTVDFLVVPPTWEPPLEDVH